MSRIGVFGVLMFLLAAGSCAAQQALSSSDISIHGEKLPTIAAESETGVAVAANAAVDDGQSVIAVGAAPVSDAGDAHIHWESLMAESGLLLAVQHTFRVATQPATRQHIRGPFFKNWGRSIEAIHGWQDGDTVFTNYGSHPIQGAAYFYMWEQNDPGCRGVEIGKSRRYWNCRLKGLGFGTVSSINFEIGPISEASIGNEELWAKEGRTKVMPGMQDFVVTPTFGFAIAMGEDALEKYLIRPNEGEIQNRFLRGLFRSILPGHSIANMLALRYPWYRADRKLVSEY